MNTKLSSLEQRATAAEQLAESARERRRLQHKLLEELRVEKADLAKSLDLVKQREIELRRRRDSFTTLHGNSSRLLHAAEPVSYTHLRAHETDSYLVCRLLLEKKKKQ